MLDLIQNIMKNGYTDEHNHELHGAAAISHFMYRPVSSISQCEINAGKKFVQNHLNR